MSEQALVWSLAGQALGFSGSVLTLAEPFLSKKKAIDLGTSNWVGDTDEENEQLPLVQEMLRQSRNARLGLGLIAAGFFLQGIATVLSF